MPGEVLSLATSDAEVSTLVVHQVAQACAGIAGLTVAVGVLFWTDPCWASSSRWAPRWSCWARRPSRRC
ncbi:hypothetical protein [Nocardioides zeae]